MHRHTSIAWACAGLCLAVNSATAAPVPLPDPGVTGFKFPEAKATVMGWVDTGKAAPVLLHGWGLWTALTMPSGQDEFGMKNVPVYLTWLTPAEIAALPSAEALAAAAAVKPRLFKLEKPRQLTHGGRIERARPAVAMSAASGPAGSPGAAVPPDTNVFVTMGYDPAAQKFAQANSLFSMKALKAIYDAGTGDIRSIPTFPADALATKPTYKVITAANLINGSIYKMPAWPGTPAVITPAITQDGFPQTSWPGCVYVDIRNSGPSTTTGVDASCKQGPTKANTYALGDFIHYPITTANLASFDSLLGGSLAVGDVVLLMGMHVTTREIDEWTWQTYFWTPNPAKPPLPSSAATAQARPPQLKGAAAHYAMSIGYQMVAPNQPITGGKSVGGPVTAYNPYLEADFNAATFGTPPANPGILKPGSAKPYMATVGVQTNCMTCHSAATVLPTNASASLPYLTNFYVSRNDPAFKGFLQVDFLWSIQGTAK